MKVWLLGGSTAGLFFNNLLPNLSLGVTAREQVRDMRSISIARRRLAIALLGVLVITSWTTIHTGLTLSTKSSNASSNLLDSNSIGPLSSDQCNDLQYHESGHWRHQHFYGKETANVTYMPDTVEKEYLHKESYWLRGHALPVDWVKEGCKESASTNGQGLMYVSTIGNQCGCNADVSVCLAELPSSHTTDTPPTLRCTSPDRGAKVLAAIMPERRRSILIALIIL